MSKFVLIDYENIHPKNLDWLKEHDCKLKVFLSATQARLPLDTVKALQVFGPDVEYIQIMGSGHNALDFHIAYYLGQLSRDHPDAEFYVISKDQGFDPLLMHVRNQHIHAHRVSTVTEITSEKKRKKAKTVVKGDAMSIEQRATLVSDDLAKSKNRPKTLTRLRALANSRFSNKLLESELDTLIDVLKQNGIVTVTGEKLSYPL